MPILCRFPSQSSFHCSFLMRIVWTLPTLERRASSRADRERDIRRYVNAERVGLWAFSTALSNLQQAGMVRYDPRKSILCRFSLPTSSHLDHISKIPGKKQARWAVPESVMASCRAGAKARLAAALQSQLAATNRLNRAPILPRFRSDPDLLGSAHARPTSAILSAAHRLSWRRSMPVWGGAT